MESVKSGLWWKIWLLFLSVYFLECLVLLEEIEDSGDNPWDAYKFSNETEGGSVVLHSRRVKRQWVNLNAINHRWLSQVHRWYCRNKVQTPYFKKFDEQEKNRTGQEGICQKAPEGYTQDARGDWHKITSSKPKVVNRMTTTLRTPILKCRVPKEFWNYMVYHRRIYYDPRMPKKITKTTKTPRG